MPGAASSLSKNGLGISKFWNRQKNNRGEGSNFADKEEKVSTKRGRKKREMANRKRKVPSFEYLMLVVWVIVVRGCAVFGPVFYNFSFWFLKTN